MRKMILFVFIGVAAFCVHAQNVMVESPKDSCYEITILSKTTDQLYMDSAFYFMIKSPLDFFDGYKEIYDDYPEVQTIELKVDLGAVLVLTLDNKYQCFWWLKEGMLYLSDITFFTVNRDQVNKVFPNKEHYELMENLTKLCRLCNWQVCPV